MKQKTLLRSVVATGALLALCALLLRVGQLQYELPQSGTRATLLIVVSVVFVLMFGVFSLTAEPRSRAAQVLAPHSLSFFAYFPAAALIAVGAVFGIFGTQGEAVGLMAQLVRLLEPIAALASAAAMGWMAYRCLLGRRPSPSAYMCLCIYLALHLILRFQTWNTDPSIADYCYGLLALICQMLAAFYLAGFCFNAGKYRPGLFWALCAFFFRTVTLADVFLGESVGEIFVALGLWLFAAVGAWQLLFTRSARRQSLPEEEQTPQKET